MVDPEPWSFAELFVITRKSYGMCASTTKTATTWLSMSQGIKCKQNGAYSPRASRGTQCPLLLQQKALDPFPRSYTVEPDDVNRHKRALIFGGPDFSPLMSSFFSSLIGRCMSQAVDAMLVLVYPIPYPLRNLLSQFCEARSQIECNPQATQVDMNAFIPSTPFLTRPSHVQIFRSAKSVYRKQPAIKKPARLQASIVPNAQKSPAQTYEAAVTLGAAKAILPAWKVLLLGIVAGAYIAIGALLALSVGGALPALKAANPGLQKLLFGLIGLPTGLTMVCVAGGELFTGNTALITAAVLSGKAKLSGLLNNWIWSYIGNFVGSLLIVWLVCASSALGGASAMTAAGVATTKVGMPFSTAFFKGVLCNWLVCLAVYMQNGASDFVSKFCAIMLPISAFVAMGLDHSVANMFLVPIGMKMGAEVSIKQFLLGNLLPVTLGNIFAGAVLVAGIYSLAFGKAKQ